MQLGDVRLFVRHKVADFAAWKKGFDNLAPVQERASGFHIEVYRAAHDPNDVTVVHDFHDLEKAEAFLASADLKAKMVELGVLGAPEIWFTIKEK